MMPFRAGTAVVALLATLGCATGAEQPSPPPPLLLSAISAGTYATCGAGLDGTAYCWGDDPSGQLGFAADSDCASRTQTCALKPGIVATSSRFAGISSGGAHACGISGGTIYCWGDNQFGQMGDLAPPETCGPQSTPCARAPTQVYVSQTASQVSAGGAHSCAVLQDSTAACWGYGAAGRLGTGSTANTAAPDPVQGGLRFSTISAGGAHTCGLTTLGVAYCWGFNNLGQLGDSTTTAQSVPTLVVTSRRFQRISAGVAGTCAIAVEGDVLCWGAAGSLGPAAATGTCGGPYPCATTPAPVSGGLLFTDITVGEQFACGVTAGGGYCWGTMPGLSAHSDAPVPFGTIGAAGGDAFLAISAGFDHACGITAGHVAYCWGNYYHGMLGDGFDFHASPGPVRVIAP